MLLAQLGIKQAAVAPATSPMAAPAAPAPATAAAPTAAPGPPMPNVVPGPKLPLPAPGAGGSFTMALPTTGGPVNVDPATGAPLMTQEQAMQLAQGADKAPASAPKASDPDSPTVKEPGSFLGSINDRLSKIKSATSPMFLGDIEPKSPTGRSIQPTTPAIPGALQPGQKGYDMYNFFRKGVLSPLLRTGLTPGGQMTDRTSPFAASWYQAADDINSRYPQASPWKQLLTNFVGPVVNHFTGVGEQQVDDVGNSASEAWQNWQNQR